MNNLYIVAITLSLLLTVFTPFFLAIVAIPFILQSSDKKVLIPGVISMLSIGLFEWYSGYYLIHPLSQILLAVLTLLYEMKAIYKFRIYLLPLVLLAIAYYVPIYILLLAVQFALCIFNFIILTNVQSEYRKNAEPFVQNVDRQITVAKELFVNLLLAGVAILLLHNTNSFNLPEWEWIGASLFSTIVASWICVG